MVNDDGVLYVVDMQGNSMAGWPVDANATISKSIALSDLDGDGSSEVIAVTEFTDILEIEFVTEEEIYLHLRI